MDYNKFIQKCKNKYSDKGVTMIEISVWDDVCMIYLSGKIKSPDLMVDKSIPPPYRKIEDDEMDEWVVYANCKFEMPLNEKEVFKCLDSWFNDKKIKGYE